jgi:hypothetical protein
MELSLFMLVLKNIFGLLYVFSFIGFASKKLDKNLILAWSTGFYSYILVCFILCFSKLFTYETMLLITIFSICLAAFKLKFKLNRFNNPAFKSILFFVSLMPILSIIWLRCSAPPYFIDTLQYHLPLVVEYIKHQGFVDLPDYFFSQTHTNFAAEIPNAVMLLFWGTDSWNLVNFGFVLVIQAQLWKFFEDHPHSKLVWLVSVLLTLSCGTFFHSVVYGKTEIVIICVMMDLLLRLKIQRDWDKCTRVFFHIGLGFLPLLKLSMAPMALAIFCYALLVDLRTYDRQLLAPCAVALGMLLLLIKNAITHGMIFFPFSFDRQQVPEALAQGVKAWMGAEPSHNIQEWLHGLQYFYMGRPSMGFNAQGFAVCITLGCAVAVWKKKWSLLLMGLFVFGNWAYWFLTYRFPHSTFRLCFPIFFIFFVVLCDEVFKTFAKPILKGFLLLVCCWVLIFFYKEGRILPGIKYNLGQQTLAEYYVNMEIHIGVLAQNLPEEVLTSSSLCAVVSEYAGAVNFPQAYYINLSKDFDRSTVDLPKFMMLLKEKNIKYIMSDHSNSGSFFNANLFEAELNRKLEKIQAYRGASLFKIVSN